MHVYACVLVCVRTCICMSECMCVHVDMCVYMYSVPKMFVHACVCVCVYSCVYACMSVCFLEVSEASLYCSRELKFGEFVFLQAHFELHE